MNKGLLRGFSLRRPDIVYTGDSNAAPSTSSTSFVDVGASVWTRDVVGPPSGLVLLLGSIVTNNPNTGANADVIFGYRVDSGEDVYCGAFAFGGTNGPLRAPSPLHGVISNLTPGRTYSVALRWRVTSGTVTMEGSTRGGVQWGSRMLLVPLP